MASLLDAALSRITGAPGESADTNAPIAPKQSFSEILNPYITTGGATQTTPNFDPAAEQAAAFQAQMAAAAAPAVAAAPAAATAPAATAPVPSGFNEAAIRETMRIAGADQGAINATVAAQQSAWNSPYGGGTAAVAAPAPKPLPSKPVNPGPRAPWQASAQYWKDLDAYTKAGGR